MPTLAKMQLKVAIVDDDARYRASIAHAVMSAPDMTLVGAADDVESGKALLTNRSPDVLLVDLGLPSGSGVALIAHAAAHLPSCDVMVVTVFGDERSVLASIEAGATGYLLKDLSNVDLADQIRSLRSGGSPISPVIARQLLNRFALSKSDATVDERSLGSESPSELSAQEHKVLVLSSRGHTYDEIAVALGVSRQTVLTYVKRSYRKLQVHSKMAAVHEARRMGWLRT